MFDYSTKYFNDIQAAKLYVETLLQPYHFTQASGDNSAFIEEYDLTKRPVLLSAGAEMYKVWIQNRLLTKREATLNSIHQTAEYKDYFRVSFWTDYTFSLTFAPFIAQALMAERIYIDLPVKQELESLGYRFKGIGTCGHPYTLDNLEPYKTILFEDETVAITVSEYSRLANEYQQLEADFTNHPSLKGLDSYIICRTNGNYSKDSIVSRFKM